MDEFEIWHRQTVSTEMKTPPDGAWRLIVPEIEPVGLLPYELAGLLPNREHSKDLMDLIDRLPEKNDRTRSVIGLFAADPFLNCKRVAGRLLSKGYNHFSNIPPVDGYGSEFLETLDNVAAGRIQEQQNLKQLVDCGLTLSPAVADIKQLSAALAYSPRRLWVVPNFDMWRESSICAQSLLALCKKVVQRTDVPVLLVAGGTGLSETDALEAGAKGILL